MSGLSSDTALNTSRLPLRAGWPAHKNRSRQHDFSQAEDVLDRTAVLDLARELADALKLELSDAALDGVRTRQDLIELVVEKLDAHTGLESETDGGSALRVRISPGNSPAGWYMERSLPWSPYALETIWDDAVNAGSGSVIDVITPHGTPRSSIARLEQRFAPLRYRGVRVRVRVAFAVER